MQYGIRLAEMYGDNDMPYPEFLRLLSGITAKTPLGIIVGIRAEEDKDMLKHFNNEQHTIRNEWRNNHSAVEDMTEEEKIKAEKEVQEMFAKMFS